MATNGSGTNGKPTVLVVVQLSGGNDFMNTVIPYRDPVYYDYRKSVGIPEDQVIPIDDTYGFHPAMGPMKEIWDEGDMAIVAGVGGEHGCCGARSCRGNEAGVCAWS